MADDDVLQNVLELTGLTPMPYRLGYGIPLIIMSTVLTFAGAFLTLDRTRSFAPLSVGRSGKVLYRLEGGIGGLVGGWAFGLHLCTFLTLLISNTRNVKPLGVVPFLVVWALGGIVTSLAAGRWRIAALLFMGINGGTALGLGLAVLVHPPQLARQIFVGILAPCLTVACLLPAPRVHLPAFRAAAAASGAFGIVVGAAVLGNIPAWANVWNRLWVDTSLEWGTRAEYGLTAAFWILTALGGASNWFLRRQFGENPDQKWDSYLAHYAASLPTRAGSFEPHTTWFDRWFKGTPSNPVVFPTDEELHAEPFESPLLQNKLKSKGKKTNATTGGAIKFQPLEMSSDSDSDTDLVKKIPLRSRPFAPRTSSSATSATAVSERARGKKKAAAGEDDYSDAEAALPVLAKQPRDSPGWKPPFLVRAQSTGEQAPAGAVPVTPSLMNALDRIQRAQSDAYGALPRSPGSGDDKDESAPGREDKDKWRGFWADVRAKAMEPASPQAGGKK